MEDGEEETEEHAFWRCPAWRQIRAKWLGAEEVDMSDLPRITQTCAIVTKAAQDRGLAARFPDVSPPCAPTVTPPGEHDDTFSYGRRVGYTDGSCIGTKCEHALRSAGYGLAWGKDHPNNVAAPLEGPWQSSQRAELTAAVRMTEAAPGEPLLIRTDSAWTRRLCR